MEKDPYYKEVREYMSSKGLKPLEKGEQPKIEGTPVFVGKIVKITPEKR